MLMQTGCRVFYIGKTVVKVNHKSRITYDI